MWLKIDDEVIFMNGDSVSSLKQLPKKVYKVDFNKKMGIFLKESEIKTAHGKIYGNSQNIADHIVQAYKLNDPNRNMGVLLSGGRGLGKTLTTRLVIEQLKGDFPIIIISEFLPGLPDFLSNLKNCVILMDEFEKFMGGNANGGDNEDDQTKQETILSCLDGNTGCTGNLFLLTANNIWKIDENLKSRPGRIRYHYRYESENADIVRQYCQDNLKRKDIIEEVVKTLGIAKYVSLDIITAFVDELNNFPNLTPTQVMEFFNIESSETKYKIHIAAEVNGKQVVYERTFRNYLSEEWCTLENKFRSKYDEDETVPEHIMVSLDQDDLPAIIYGKEQLDPSVIDLVDASDGIDTEDVHIHSVFIEDPEFAGWSKRYNKSMVV